MATSSGRARRAVAAWNAAVEPRFGRRSEVLHHPFGEGTRRLDVGDVVEDVQCLERRIRPRFPARCRSHGQGASNATIAGGGTVRFQNV